MWDDIEINVGVVILAIIEKVCYHQGRRYRFSGLLTRFFRGQEVVEEAIDNSPAVNVRTRKILS